MHLLTQPPKNRLGIFFFYDKDGIVDEYVNVLLQDMKKHMKELLIVCNGKLTSQSREFFEQLSNHVVVRENKGFDVWAYKEGMQYFGWDKLAEFDELLLFNFTLFGPIYPFEEMFHTMNEQDLDFWGITKHHGWDFDPFGKVKYGYLPEHIQSHFVAIRKRMHTSYEFKSYWDNMREITSYDEAISYHEAIFTKDFADKGFKWNVFVDTDDLKETTPYPLLMTPTELVKNRRCPIIKRRSFFHHTADFLNFTTGEPTLELYEYIRNNIDYDINLIWDNILRTDNQIDIKNAMHLNYVLPTDQSKDVAPDRKIALIMHIYFEDLIDYCLRYARSMPPHTDVYITTDTVKKQRLIEEAFKELECSRVEVLLIENRGRDVSALLVAGKPFVYQYDYVCFVHDKKTKQVVPFSKGDSFSYRCFENTLKNRHFVHNVINTFEENPRLGMLSPPPPYHADFYHTIGLEWSNNFDNTRKLAENLGLQIDMREYKEPVAPLGTMFWFRPKALRTLFDYNWKYEDFPKEPNDTNGTILHAIERIYPYVSQHEGYYPAWVLADSSARMEITNLYYMLRQINVAYFAKAGPSYHFAVVDNIARKMRFKIPIKVRFKETLRRRLSPRMFKAVKKVYQKFKRQT
jgi:Lipopolysaccharide biosynthesis protein